MTVKEKIKKFVPKFLLRAYHFCWALFGAMVFNFSGYDKKLKIIGVTGTSGKSTTVDFITRILEEDGNKVASLSSIRFKVGEKEWENKYKMTMPGRFVIQKLLSQARKARCEYVVLEVTSEGIRQFRHKFINFDCAVFTNLTPEHIESHGGFHNYRKEKLKLFRATKNIHVINTDDENARYFLELPANKKITYGLNKGDYNLQNTKFNLNLAGDFNSYNALAAISVAKAYGVSFEVCKKALEKVKSISGRMEIISSGSLPSGRQAVKVIVDYAHTPAQLEAVYKTFEAENLICVLGSCGGGRDKWKRPILGEIAAKYCKETIITNEDPYDEDPSQILSEIKSGISNSKFPIPNFHEILDRKKAIESAIKLAKPGEVVIITGKGSEPWMCVENGRKIPWDDRQIAREALKNNN
jgi:UDP-N-acetylmuramoyl-L-alanyl-D-glutamate--2,6-diaminopimelate ligase